ncbi:DNA-binding transcriptional LysR family regulator [Pantoea sp. AN62]|uniref:LysR family transcriptional regulator n=1 Tax=Pantoea TaxID=53335 RepID=UPI000A255FED|nr:MULTISPECIES: LysR family transcriptional regulator [Pantoea]MCQ5471520.1 LysR family transcriptional regulator [Pantoea brenneri]MDU4748203.1 LysR family transcriptional regulator [Pantoea sp.]ORM56885.1 LysR family transcriptional regulator [Pantoea brenneri]OXM20540.1 LysR family transcriptional regulator [Pantoea sp. AV62]
MMADKNALEVFVIVAQTRNFRLAAEQLGVTRPAISQTLRRLEDLLNLSLMQRTTRTIQLTEAGQRLYAEVAPAINQLNRAISDIAELAAEPRGQLRLAISSIAERMLGGELLASFMAAYPQIELDITVTDEEFDIVDQGYDAGVRLGEVIAQDMIAVPVSAAQRQVAVASPDYLARHGTPQHPQQLIEHRCIGWRKGPGLSPYRWEFADQGREFDVAVNPQLTTNDMGVMIRTACAGGGISFGMEETFQPYIARGELVTLLDAWLPSFAGFYLYFPSRKNLAPKLRALIDHVKL